MTLNDLVGIYFILKSIDIGLKKKERKFLLLLFIGG
jgi:hypothetical protein